MTAVILPFGENVIDDDVGPFIYSYDDSTAFFAFSDSSSPYQARFYGVKTSDNIVENNFSFGNSEPILCMLSFPNTKIIILAFKTSSSNTWIKAIDVQNGSSYSVITWGGIPGGNVDILNSEVK